MVTCQRVRCFWSFEGKPCLRLQEASSPRTLLDSLVLENENVLFFGIAGDSTPCDKVQSSWNVMAHGDAQEGKWRRKWRIEWVASILHTTSEHGVSSITTADARTSAASSRLNWRSRRFKWTRPFRRKTKSGFCACAMTLQTQSTIYYEIRILSDCLFCIPVMGLLWQETGLS